jgi:hypothetical protein
MLSSLRNSRETVVMINREIENRRESLKSAVVARREVIAAPDLQKREEIARKRAELHKQLKALDKAAVNLDKSDTKRHIKTMDIIGQIDSICDAKTKKTHDCIENLLLAEDEISTAIRMGHRLKSSNMIGANRHGNITKTAGLLRELMAKVKTDSDVAVYHAEAYRMPAYSYRSTSDDLGCLTMYYARKMFNLSFGLQTEFDGDILVVAATDEGIFAALCVNETEQRLFIWKIEAATVIRVIDKSVSKYIDQIVNMTASPDNRLVLLRKRSPQLVIVSPALGTIKTIKVSKLKDPDSVAVTSDGFYMVMEGVWPANLVVVNEKGEIIYTTPTERVQRRIVWRQRVIFTCDWRRIYPYAWQGARFITKQPPIDHEIPDFNMVDLTLGNNSGIFVVGQTVDGRMRLYRLRKEKENEPHTYHEFILTDQNGIEHSDGIYVKGSISLDVCGSHLIVAYKDLEDKSCAVYYRLLTLD